MWFGVLRLVFVRLLGCILLLCLLCLARRDGCSGCLRGVVIVVLFCCFLVLGLRGYLVLLVLRLVV